MREWEKETKPYADKRYLIYKAIEEKQNLLAEKLAGWYKELLKADFHFLKDLASAVKAGKGCKEKIEDIMEATKRQFHGISNQIDLFKIDGE